MSELATLTGGGEERRFTEEQLSNCGTEAVNKRAYNSTVNPPILYLSLFHGILTQFLSHAQQQHEHERNAGTGTLIFDLLLSSVPLKGG